MLPDAGRVPSRRDSASGATSSPVHSGSFRQRTGVLTARALDAAALYDPRAERYVTLNPVATRIWELLDGGLSAPVITARVCAEFDASSELVARDVAAQIDEFLRDGLIEPQLGSADLHSGSIPERRAAPERDSNHAVASAPIVIQVPSVFSCGLTLWRIKWLLRGRRFEGTLAWLRARTKQIPASDIAEVSVVRAMEYAVAMAGALFPARARCLEQSLALYYLARRQGVAVRYCQGMQLYPFEAHAWVEYRGEVVNDVPEHVKYFTKFPDQLP